MKIYLIDYNIDEREPKRIYVSQYSSYKIGITVNGVDNNKIKFTKKSDGKPIAAEEEFKGYNTYSFQASTPETTTYNIWVPYSNTGITFTLDVITTDSTVAELSSGGGMPTDLELNSLKVGNSDLPTISADLSNLYLKSEELNVNAINTDVIRTGDIFNSSTGENFHGIAIKCDLLEVSQAITCNNGSFTSVNSGNIYAYNNLYGPGLTCSLDSNDYSNNIDISGKRVSIVDTNDYGIDRGIDIGEYNDSTSGGTVNGFRIRNVTELTLIDSTGMRYKALPQDITDSNGNTYKVLILETA